VNSIQNEIIIISQLFFILRSQFLFLFVLSLRIIPLMQPRQELISYYSTRS